CQALQHKIELLQKNQAELDQRLAESSEQQRATKIDQEQTKAVIEQLRDEFERKLVALDQAKVDKSQIGQAFIEWGMKVKQTGLN
ncbi:MAG: hypothetical protein ONB13_08275, partial [candidate division KSB1 bacterium]|nr:hypothetical protein [candidate division KSB1 bacterium]